MSRPIDADALIDAARSEVLSVYSKTKNENAEHLDLDDDKLIYLFGLEQYLKVKFAYHWLKNRVGSAPTIDPVPTSVPTVKHGKWIQSEKAVSTAVMNACNLCGTESSFRYSYCPMCGARMDEEGDSECS